MSRVHQGQSASYQRKIKVREARTFDRLMFRCAKYFHDKKYYGTSDHSACQSSADDGTMDRAFIRRWKTKIYRYLEKERKPKVTLEEFDQYTEDEIFDMVRARFRNEDFN